MKLPLHPVFPFEIVFDFTLVVRKIYFTFDFFNLFLFETFIYLSRRYIHLIQNTQKTLIDSLDSIFPIENTERNSRTI